MNYTPRRVVSLQPSATQILVELGLGERVVACTKWCADVCPGIAGGRTIVADSWSAKSAEILAVRPDLVIAAVPYQVEAVAEILRAGLPFLGLAPRTLADVYGDITKIAGIMGAAARGEALIARMQSDIAAVRKKAAGGARASARPPKVFCEEWGKPLIASQPWVKELIETLGGEFVGEPGRQITAEAVRAADPEVLIAAWCGAGDRVPLEKIVRERHWEDTRAARAGRVFCVRDELLNTPGPALVGGLHGLAAAIRPEVFGDRARGLRRIASTPETRRHGGRGK